MQGIWRTLNCHLPSTLSVRSLPLSAPVLEGDLAVLRMAHRQGVGFLPACFSLASGELPSLLSTRSPVRKTNLILEQMSGSKTGDQGPSAQSFTHRRSLFHFATLRRRDRASRTSPKAPNSDPVKSSCLVAARSLPSRQRSDGLRSNSALAMIPRPRAAFPAIFSIFRCVVPNSAYDRPVVRS